ncbi:LLM class flavin-dependent oxidoreductase [Phytohabitans kaempferiae]|uniref:LLM class flavin-dependent oxidoreductase n=1 Tax=Phytohabitans kaempferiae TaxID=1620943 RepID=A0ABV6MAS2_9ACTN
MRIGLQLATGDLDIAAGADAAGLCAVLTPGSAAGVDSAVAARIAARTENIRIVLRVRLGVEHPVTLAEEVAVVDHVSAGRVVALVDTADLDPEAAAEDLALLRASWSGRVIRHAGPRWQVPSGVMGPGMPTTLAVTPKPAQLDLPVWLDGTAAGAGLPVLARSFADADPATQVQPAVDDLTGDLDTDRRRVTAWAEAGATHLFVRQPDGAGVDFVRDVIARYLVPETAMPHLPRIVVDSSPPLPWPGPRMAPTASREDGLDG